MYLTRPMTKEEIALVRSKCPFAGALEHTVIGYTVTGETSIECSDEKKAASVSNVVFIRHRMPNGKYQFRAIVSK